MSDYADEIAAAQIAADGRLSPDHPHMHIVREIVAAAAREGHALGYGARTLPSSQAGIQTFRG